ncbi:UNVERIFIED_CONTAM: hypothetical protein FKN15_003818 [Acipenser sinensis]
MKSSIINIEMIRSQEFEQGYKLTLALLLLLLHPVLGFRAPLNEVKLPEDQEEGLKFTGLSKEELMKVAGTPGWVRTRWALLVLFWLGWLGMLAAAIVIIVQAPRCQPVPEQSWWHKGALYRIGAVAAFMDSNGDGTGDLAAAPAQKPPDQTVRETRWPISERLTSSEDGGQVEP